MIAIIDYGVGNLASIQNMLKKIGSVGVITSDVSVISSAEKLILPGVGAFDTCAAKLKDSGLIPLITDKVMKQYTPVLGICVGMQLLHDSSEEGSLPGLGWIKGDIVRFQKDRMPSGYKIPHMGWSDVNVSKPSKLMAGIDEPRFYFVHSYHSLLTDTCDELVSASYGYAFTAAVEHRNILGVQFHPEKSHRFGMRLFENFVGNY
jgi:imidazole glycerol-phosphate synthase subunit HisH